MHDQVAETMINVSEENIREALIPPYRTDAADTLKVSIAVEGLFSDLIEDAGSYNSSEAVRKALSSLCEKKFHKINSTINEIPKFTPEGRKKLSDAIAAELSCAKHVKDGIWTCRSTINRSAENITLLMKKSKEDKEEREKAQAFADRLTAIASLL
jgi:Arc/MetJ-type ribon-helix-helix transcriptional regulator